MRKVIGNGWERRSVQKRELGANERSPKMGAAGQKWEGQAKNGSNRPDQKWETAKPDEKHQTRPFSCVKIAVIK